MVQTTQPPVMQVMPDGQQPPIQGAYPGAGMQPPPDPNNPNMNIPMPPAPGQGGGGTSPFAPVSGTYPATPATPGAAPGAIDPIGSVRGNVRTGVAETAGAKPADYQSVQGFADQAYAQARRNIDPQQEQAGRRMEQDLINKGIDPRSEQGMAMLDQQNRNFSDQDNSANFAALQFGQGIQQQAFGQDLQNRQMTNQMTQANMQADIAKRGQNLNQYGIDVGARTAQGAQDVQRYGMDQSFNLGMSGQDLQRYQGDQKFGLGMGQLDMQRQGQDFNQMIGLEGIDFRNRAYGDKRSDYQDALTMSLMGMTPIPGVVGYDPSNLAGTQLGSSAGGGILSTI